MYIIWTPIQSSNVSNVSPTKDPVYIKGAELSREGRGNQTIQSSNATIFIIKFRFKLSQNNN